MLIYTIAGVKIGLLRNNIGTGKRAIFYGKSNIDIINQAIATIWNT